MSKESTKDLLDSVCLDFDDLESSVESSDIESGDELELGETTTKTIITDLNTSNKHINVVKSQNNGNAIDLDAIKEKLKDVVPLPNIGNIAISNSTNVTIGHVINIRGDLIINNYKDKETPHSENNSIKKTNDYIDRKEEEKDPERQRTPQELLLSKNLLQPLNPKIPSNIFHMVFRTNWMAMPTEEQPTRIKEPVKLVIISHTATEGFSNVATNIGIVRDMQTFHVETRGWNDIAYNFLIGCCGNVYEGRGWGVQGAHTKGYNHKSIGISFIGCFMSRLPPENSINALKNLLKLGVQRGSLSADYKLVAHCQCSSTESPGKKLFEKLKTLEHFNELTSDDADER